MVLCYRFVTETVLITHQCFKQLLNSACTALRFSLFLTLHASSCSLRVAWQWTPPRRQYSQDGWHKLTREMLHISNILRRKIPQFDFSKVVISQRLAGHLLVHLLVGCGESLWISCLGFFFSPFLHLLNHINLDQWISLYRSFAPIPCLTQQAVRDWVGP